MRRPSVRQLANTVMAFEDSPELVPEEPNADSRKEPEVPEICIFDKLSKTLGEQAATLEEGDAKLERQLRPKVVKALRNYSSDQVEVGHLLEDYKKIGRASCRERV